MSSGSDSQRISRQETLRIIDSVPQVSVDLIITNDEGKVLLGKRVNRPAQGYWFVPGGRIQKNESVSHAIARISLTETGVSLMREDGQLMDVFDHFYPDNFLEAPEINTHYVAIAYRFLINGDLKIFADDQHAELRWWTVHELLVSDLVHENTRAYFQKL